MFKVYIAGSTALAFVASAAVAAPKQPQVLGHSSKWQMNYGEDACTLSSSFGEGKDGVLLAITQYEPGNGFEMKIYSPALSHDEIPMKVDVAFGEQLARRYDGLSAKASDPAKTPTVILGGMRLDGWRAPMKNQDPSIKPPTISPEQEAAVTSISFNAPGRTPIRLKTGSMKPAMDAMRSCTDDLLRHWGFDPAVQANLTRPAAPVESPGKWLRSSDYPTGALVNGENGLVRFRLDVEPDGAVSKCRILYRTNPDSFADLSCKLLQQRARFTPALDAAGKPVKSSYMSQIRWMAGSW